MVDTKISAETSGGAAQAGDLIRIARAGANFNLTASAIAGLTVPAISGEVGVLNPLYAVGDVRRYGVFPDGVDLTGLGFTIASPTVTAIAGTFTAAMVGMAVCSPNACATASGTPLKVSAVAGDGSSATLTGNAIATQAGAGARVGTWWENSFPTYTNAILSNSVHPQITIVWPHGKYVTSLNFSSAQAGAKMHFDKAEFSSIFHIIADAGFPTTGLPLAGLMMSGQFITYDRFGSIGLLNSDLSALNILCRSDPTKSLYGTVGRGVHVYTQIIGNKFGDITIEDCGIGAALNTDAAFCLDDSASSGNTFGNLWIKDSAGHAAYILGSNQTFRSIRIDGYGYGAQDRGMQESIGLTQSQELCGVWTRRNSGLHILDLKINQSVSGARANALYDVRVEDTANATLAPAFYSAPRIDVATISNIKHRGISIGDRNNAGSFAELTIGDLQVQPVSGAVLDTGYSIVHVNANSTPATFGRSKLAIERLIVRNPSASLNDLLQVPVNTEISIGTIDTGRISGHAGRVLTINGRGWIGNITHYQGGVSSSPTPFTIANDGPTVIGAIVATTINAALTSITALDLTGAVNWEVGPVSLSGFRGIPVVKVIGASNGLLKLGLVTESSVTGWGVRFQSNTNVRLEGGKITGLALGTTGSALGNIRCSAVNVLVTGNTANTDLANGQVLVDASSLNVTL